MTTLSIEIPWNVFEEERKIILLSLGKDIEIKGFRKGYVPLSLFEQKFGKEATSRALQKLGSKVVQEVIKKERESVLSAVRAAKIAQITIGKPVQLTFRFLSIPDVEIDDLKKVKVINKGDINVKDSEVLKVLKEIWEEDKKVSRENILYGVREQNVLVGADGKTVLTSKKETAKDVFSEEKLTDAWAKKIDRSVNTLDELKDKIREALKKQKKAAEDDAWGKKLIDKVAEYLRIDVPREVVDAEVVAKEERFYQTLRSMGMSPADYVALEGFSIEDMWKKWRDDISQMLTRYITVRTLAAKFKIEVTDDDMKGLAKGEAFNDASMRYDILQKKVVAMLEKEVTIVNR